MCGAVKGVLVLACCLAHATAGHAQSSTSVILHSAATAPRGEWVSGESFSTGRGTGIDVLVDFNRVAGAYIGWVQLTFEMGSETQGSSARRAADTGLRVGVLGRVPYSLGGARPFGLAGAIAN